MRWMIVPLLLIAASPARAEVREEDFYGTWIPSGESARSCLIEGEGAHFTVHRNYYQPGDGASCADAKTWLRNGRLRVSATCEGEEYGFRATTRELKLETPTTLTTSLPGEKAPQRFVPCTMPAQALEAALLTALEATLDEMSRLESSILELGPQTAETDARMAKGKDEIALKHGYASSRQVEEVRLIALDILQFGEEKDYLARRHKPANVAVVMANRAALEPLLPSSPEPARPAQ